MAPMMPHVTEDAYQSGFATLDGSKSIHVSKWPVAVLFDEQAERDGDLIRDVIGAIRTYKSERKLSLNSELEMVEIIGDASEKFVGSEGDISSTVRAKELKLASKLNLEEKVIALKPLLAKIGPTFKKNAGEVTARIKALDIDKDADAVANGTYEFELSDGMKVVLSRELVDIEKKMTLQGKAVDTVQVGELLIAIQP
jgi:valyl-tRNA synthetase